MQATSLDLSEAFHHIPIHKNYRFFLAFCIQDTNYWYKACPFGLNPIPQVFTEVCTVVKFFARKAFNCTIYSYLDDWLFLSPSRATTALVTRAFVRLCLKLGLLVNLEKSDLSPPHTATGTPGGRLGLPECLCKDSPGQNRRHCGNGE